MWRSVRIALLATTVSTAGLSAQAVEAIGLTVGRQIFALRKQNQQYNGY
jgi:hypothetical protein